MPYWIICFFGMDKVTNINKYIIFTCIVMLWFLFDASNICLKFRIKLRIEMRKEIWIWIEYCKTWTREKNRNKKKGTEASAGPTSLNSAQLRITTRAAQLLFLCPDRWGPLVSHKPSRAHTSSDCCWWDRPVSLSRARRLPRACASARRTSG